MLSKVLCKIRNWRMLKVVQSKSFVTPLSPTLIYRQGNYNMFLQTLVKTDLHPLLEAIILACVWLTKQSIKQE